MSNGKDLQGKREISRTSLVVEMDALLIQQPLRWIFQSPTLVSERIPTPTTKDEVFDKDMASQW